MSKQIEKVKKIFQKLKRDNGSVLFGEEKTNNNLFRKLKKCWYNKDKYFVILLKKFKNIDDIFQKNAIPIKTTFLEKKGKTDRSMLYSFDDPFWLLHADVANLEFLGKSAVDTKYCLLFIDLFTSKIYTYPMRSRRFIARKMHNFYEELCKKRKNKPMRLQTDQEFSQNEIKNLNKKFNVQMLSTNIRGGKAFAAEQKIRELKKRIFWLKTMNKSNKLRVRPNKIIRKLTNKMSKTPSEKYGIKPETVEKNSLSSESFRINFDFQRPEKVNKNVGRLIRYHKKIESRKKARLREDFELGEQVLVLA